MTFSGCCLDAHFLSSLIQVVTSVLEALKNNEHPYHNHGVEVRSYR